MLLVTERPSIQEPSLIGKLSRLGKFIAHEVPVESVKSNYSAHFEHATSDPSQPEQYKVLDTNIEQIFTNVDFHSLGEAFYFEPGKGIFSYLELTTGAKTPA
jgi:hypothetical protein